MTTLISMARFHSQHEESSTQAVPYFTVDWHILSPTPIQKSGTIMLHIQSPGRGTNLIHHCLESACTFVCLFSCLQTPKQSRPDGKHMRAPRVWRQSPHCSTLTFSSTAHSPRRIQQTFLVFNEESTESNAIGSDASHVVQKPMIVTRGLSPIN